MKLMTRVPKVDSTKWFGYIDAWKAYPFKKRVDREFAGGAVYGDTYVKHSDHTDKPFSVTYHEWKQIVDCFFKHLMPEIINGRDFHWPHIGVIGLRKLMDKAHGADKPTFKKLVDFNETKKVYGEWNKANPDDKKFVYYDNSHTNGYVVHSYWSRKNRPIKHGQVYKFRLSKVNKRKLAQALKSDPTHIYRIEDFKKR